MQQRALFFWKKKCKDRNEGVSRFSWRAAAALILVSLIIGFQCPSACGAHFMARCSLFFHPFFFSPVAERVSRAFHAALLRDRICWWRQVAYYILYICTIFYVYAHMLPVYACYYLEWFHIMRGLGRGYVACICLLLYLHIFFFKEPAKSHMLPVYACYYMPAIILLYFHIFCLDMHRISLLILPLEAHVCCKALSRLCQGSVKALLRFCKGSVKALLRLC